MSEIASRVKAIIVDMESYYVGLVGGKDNE